METMIRYAGLCLQGLVRVNNEDNLWYPNGCLPMIHGDLPAFPGSVAPGPGAAFAVFDGMGGEAMGETASYLAASEFGRWAERSCGLVQGEETAVCSAMNREILSSASKKRMMGTTCVLAKQEYMASIWETAGVTGSRKASCMPCPQTTQLCLRSPGEPASPSALGFRSRILCWNQLSLPLTT